LVDHCGGSDPAWEWRKKEREKRGDGIKKHTYRKSTTAAKSEGENTILTTKFSELERNERTDSK